MKVRIEKGKAFGAVEAPPSKSMSHRYLLAAALAAAFREETSVIRNMAFSEDIRATLDCLKVLGVSIEEQADQVIIKGRGNGEYRKDLQENILCCLPVRESGTTLRFLIPLCLLMKQPAVFTGEERLFQRPLSVYEDLAAEKGWQFEKGRERLKISGELTGGMFRIPGHISSQFASGLLFALPMCREDSVLELVTPVKSSPYLNMTCSVLKTAGILFSAEKTEEGGVRFLIPGNQAYQPLSVTVEGDHSNASFFEALNLFGGQVKVTGLRKDSLQGDRIFPQLFEKLKQGFQEIDLSDTPDLGPVLFAAAAALHGGRFTGTERLRDKESDRLKSMKEELLKCGIQCVEERDSFTVLPGLLKAPEQPLWSHKDHRTAMALSVLLSLTGGELEDAEAVDKSFPGFYERLKALGISVSENKG
ncbi:MAG: 3-phosphoshikimate 1-carboxyvinyltransferase [Lachnospiraceae bacterium]|nr:3-phosphoshikimate 1-carboxyvinyltransferase [Lachnospiraceae bacterium]